MIKITAKEIAFDLHHLPVDISEVQFVFLKYHETEITKLREQLRIAKDALTKIETYSVLNDEYKSFEDVAKQALSEIEAIK